MMCSNVHRSCDNYVDHVMCMDGHVTKIVHVCLFLVCSNEQAVFPLAQVVSLYSHTHTHIIIILGAIVIL